MKEKNADPIRDDKKAAHPPGIARTAATTLRREGEPGAVMLPGGEESYLTFSGGAYRWRPGDDARGLISRADEALYQAKAEGGNTIIHLD